MTQSIRPLAAHLPTLNHPGIFGNRVIAAVAATLAGMLSFSVHATEPPLASAASGIRFTCAAPALADIETGMRIYLEELAIKPEWVSSHLDATTGNLTYTLTTPVDDTNTLDFSKRALYAVPPEVVRIPTGPKRTRPVITVSRKEIALALLQHGRLTEFSGDACSVDALREHVGIRQNTVSWAETLEWGWPDGGSAAWNRKYWHRGTPTPGHPLHEAVTDAFLHQDKYSIGCYTATKLVMLQGVLDYYQRVNKNPVKLAKVEAALMKNGEPLEDVEPGKMWSFEADYNLAELARPGKLLRMESGIAPNNLVPGEWLYLWNTDPVSYQKTGYEGSNAVYLGSDKFDDYYNDNHHYYTFKQKLDEVYQWRNGVFSRSRDAAKIVPLSSDDIVRLSAPPSQGGLLHDFRVIPKLF